MNFNNANNINMPYEMPVAALWNVYNFVQCHQMIKNRTQMKPCSGSLSLSLFITVFLHSGFFHLHLHCAAVRHDNYSNDWMEIVKSLRINNKSNSIERTTIQQNSQRNNASRIENNVNAHRSILCTIDIWKNAFRFSRWQQHPAPFYWLFSWWIWNKNFAFHYWSNRVVFDNTLEKFGANTGKVCLCLSWEHFETTKSNTIAKSDQCNNMPMCLFVG